MPPNEGAIRINNQYYSDPNPVQLNHKVTGAIEIYHLGTWGAVDKANPNTIAIVACRQLGYNVGYRKSQDSASLTVPYKKFWIYRINCLANETNLDQCNFEYGLSASSSVYRYDIECLSKSQLYIGLYAFVI